MLTFEHVSFSYSREADTVRDLSFSVGDGEFVALIGSNGAGKSNGQPPGEWPSPSAERESAGGRGGYFHGKNQRHCQKGGIPFPEPGSTDLSEHGAGGDCLRTESSGAFPRRRPPDGRRRCFPPSIWTETGSPLPDPGESVSGLRWPVCWPAIRRW